MSKRILSIGLVMVPALLIGGSAHGDEKQQRSSACSETGDLKVPSEFKRVEPQSSIIAHEFQAKVGDGNDGETARVTMMAAGGDVAANIERWKGQFAGGDAKQRKTEEMKVGKWQVYVVDVNGNFAERMGGGPFAGGKVVNHENYAMAGAILVHPEGQKFFVKMIGPADVVKANREAFVNMIKSVGQ